MELKAYGDRGILLAALSEAERSAWLCALSAQLPPACEEYVVGYDSILFIGRGLSTEDLFGQCTEMSKALKAGIATPALSSTATHGINHHLIEVSYNGADLQFVATACGLSVAQVIEVHCAPTYTVRMMGFSPGFPYLEGLDPRLHLERRDSPRNHIEPGAVAIGGAHAGIYTVASPGGWHLLGHTDHSLFNLAAAQQSRPQSQEVFALSPGDQVRFQAKELT